MKTFIVRPFLFAVLLTALTCAFSGGALAQKKKTKLDAPLVTFAASSASSITLNVKAGSTGAPAGFSVQWMKLSDYQANGNQFYSSDIVCKASFSGNANNSRYNLGAGESVQVTIGDTLLDAGASLSNCGAEPLVCDTAYVFRVFAHANSTLDRSDFALSGLDESFRTIPCTPSGGCTLGYGYWKSHGPIPTGNNTNVWPVTSLFLGSNSYTDLQLQSIMNTAGAGNGLVTLAHQLIAAKLNIANGAEWSAVAGPITDADALIGTRIAPPVGTGSLAPSTTAAIAKALEDYNNGVTGPGFCQ